LIRFFTNTYNHTFIGLLVLSIAFGITGIFNPYVNTTAPLAVNYLQQFFNTINHYHILGVFINTLMITITAVVFNNICNKHELTILPSYLPAYFFIIFNCIFIDQYYAGPVIFVNYFVILSLGAILNLFDSESPYFSLFLASFLAGISTLLNISYIAFFAIVLIGINIFRPFNIRENISAFIGFAMPLYIGTMVNYLINDNFLPYQIFFPDYGNYQKFQWVFNSALPAIAIIAVLGFIRMYQNFYRNSVKQKRAIQLMILISIACIILVFTGKQNSKQEFSFLAIPLSYFFSFYFTNSKTNYFKEFLNILLLVIIVFFLFNSI